MRFVVPDAKKSLLALALTPKNTFFPSSFAVTLAANCLSLVCSLRPSGGRTISRRDADRDEGPGSRRGKQ